MPASFSSTSAQAVRPASSCDFGGTCSPAWPSGVWTTTKQGVSGGSWGRVTPRHGVTGGSSGESGVRHGVSRGPAPASSLGPRSSLPSSAGATLRQGCAVEHHGGAGRAREFEREQDGDGDPCRLHGVIIIVDVVKVVPVGLDGTATHAGRGPALAAARGRGGEKASVCQNQVDVEVSLTGRGGFCRADECWALPPVRHFDARSFANLGR